MTRPKILQEGQSYTFRSYFEMTYEADDILAELGYALVREPLVPPTSQLVLSSSELKNRLEDTLRLVSLSSEQARRESLVFPVLLEVARVLHCQLRIEYPLTVNNWLKGEMDYLLRSKSNLTVIEAKRDDLTRGFTQLAVELIALSHIEDQDVFYGAVTIGNIWQFGKLDRQQQTITQDIKLYPIPDELEAVMGILVGILETP